MTERLLVKLRASRNYNYLVKKNRSPLSSVRASNGTANMKLNMLEIDPLHISSPLSLFSKAKAITES